MLGMTGTGRGLNRRQFLVASAGLLARVGWAGEAGALQRTSVGLATDVWGIHQRSQVAAGRKGDLADPLGFLEQCHRLGARGMQGPLGVRDAEYVAKLRQFAEARDLYIEGSIDLASPRFDVERFEKEVLTAKAAGVKVIRVVVTPGRRYEQFGSAEEFARAVVQAREVLEKVEPVVARHKVWLAVENHKDHRVAERVELMKRLSSEYIGMCVDVGNSFALCEDPMEVVRAYAPWAFSVHLKDQAVREYEDGFLFADVHLGKGFLDLPGMVRVLREARPEVRFSLEVITRDSLRVPVLTAKYWATMGGVSAADLARTLKTVKMKGSAEALPVIGSLPVEAQVEAETRNIERSLAYAREQLRL